MKKLILAIAALPLLAMSATSTPAGFTDNLDEALASAKSNGKYVFACFSGSDWCGWCRKLDREVFSKPKFLADVTNDFELVFIDLPEDRSILSERAKVENEKLVVKYNIAGFPTALVLDGDGNIVTKTGYRQGGAKKYAQHLMQIRKDGPRFKEIEELCELHIMPFEREVKKIVFEDTLGRISRAVAHLPAERQEAKAKELAREFFPGGIKRVETALEDFKAKELPELISAQRAEIIEDTEKLLQTLKEQFQDLSK